jgi:hypothetical protein
MAEPNQESVGAEHVKNLKRAVMISKGNIFSQI